MRFDESGGGQRRETTLPTSSSSGGGSGVIPLNKAVPWYANTVPYTILTGTVVDGALASLALGLDVIRYTPFRMAVSGTLNQLAVAQSAAAGAGGVMRFAIYSSTNSVPDALLFDSGSIAMDGANGFKTVAAGITLVAGTTYWAATVFGVSGCSVHGCPVGTSNGAAVGVGMSTAGISLTINPTAFIGSVFGAFAAAAVQPTGVVSAQNVAIFARFA